MNKPSDTLRKLLTNNQLRETIKELLIYLPKEDSVNALSGSLFELDDSFHSGRLGFEEYIREKNKLRLSIAEIINKKEAVIDSVNKEYSFETSEENFRKKLMELLGNQYKIISQIGSGNSAILYKAFDSFLNRKVAIKVIKTPKLFSDEIQENTIQHEIKNAATFKHRNIMTIYSANFSSEPNFIILEFVEGVSLHEIIKKVGRLSVHETVEKLYYLGEALYYGHQKDFVHKSVRPHNILIDTDGMPVMSPFQLIRASVLQKMLHQHKEDLMYWSPEQLEEEEIDAKADQYSLGLVAFEMITGEPLFKGENITDVHKKRAEVEGDPDIVKKQLFISNCPDSLAQIILKMLGYNKEDKGQWKHLKEVLIRLDKLEVMLEKEVRVAKRSYNRCREKPEFFESFYTTFFDSYHSEVKEKVKALFSDIDNQYKIINHAICQIIEPESFEASIDKIMESHQFQGYKISIDDFKSFTNSLVTVIERFDNDTSEDPEIMKSWKKLTGIFISNLEAKLAS